jgi:hypothetical protein
MQKLLVNCNCIRKIRHLIIALGQLIQNGNLEVPVYLLKAKQGYAVTKMEKDKGICVYIGLYIVISASMKCCNKRKFQCGKPEHTGRFRAPFLGKNT